MGVVEHRALSMQYCQGTFIIFRFQGQEELYYQVCTYKAFYRICFYEYTITFALNISSSQLLPNLYHLGAVSREELNSATVGPIQEKLESMAGEVASVMDQQLQVTTVATLLVSDFRFIL